MTKITKNGKVYTINESFKDGNKVHELFTMTNVTLLDLSLYLEKAGFDYKLISSVVRNLHTGSCLEVVLQENADVSYTSANNTAMEESPSSSTENRVLN